MARISFVWLRASSAPILVAALLLVGFIAVLIGDNYWEQRQVRRLAVSDLRRNLDKRAAALSYFFSERASDVKSVASSGEVSAFFENKASGMTREYGPKDGRVVVAELFEKTMKERRVGSDPVYVRFALVDAAGATLAQASIPGCLRENDETWKDLFRFDAAIPAIKVERGAPSYALISAPCRFKKGCAGQIVAWLRLQTLYDHFILGAQSFSVRGDFLLYSAGLSHYPLPLVPLNLDLLRAFLRFARKGEVNESSPQPELDFEKAGGVPAAFFHNAFGASKSGAESENAFVRFSRHGVGLLAADAPVEGTPFSLMRIVSEREVLGTARPWLLPMAFGVLAILLLGGVALILKYNVKTLILQARLGEASERERAVEKVNRELRVEIGEREKAEEALLKSEKRYKDLFDNISDVVYAHDSDGRILSVNPAASAALGYAPEEIIGRNVADFLPEEHRRVFLRRYLPRVKAKGVFHGTVILVSRDGTRTLFECNNSLVEEQGHGVRITGSGRDVTERRRYEEELEKSKAAAEDANRVKSDFLANMSHELRTPLNVIIGFTELILARQCGDLTSLQEEYLKDVLEGARGLCLLIDDILDLTRMETGKPAFEASEVQLPGLLARSLAIVREKASEHSIDLSYEGKNIPPVIIADERKIKQTLYNLLANALKFTPAGGRVKLKAESADGRILFCVEDNGIGIRKDDLQRIFQPFEKVDNSLGRRFQGAGVGLCLTRSMVEIQGGEIWAESEGEGKGARLCFVIPAGRPNPGY